MITQNPVLELLNHCTWQMLFSMKTNHGITISIYFVLKVTSDNMQTADSVLVEFIHRYKSSGSVYSF